MNKATEFPSLFTRISGTLMGYDLTTKDLLGTQWSAETTTQDPKMEQYDARGMVRFFSVNCVVRPCNPGADVMLKTKRDELTVTSSGVPIRLQCGRFQQLDRYDLSNGSISI